MKLAFITKKEVDFFIQDAINFVNKNFDSKVFYSDWNSSIDQNLYNDDIDIVVSYLSRWILPKEILNNTKFCAINFHPAPPNYRGYGPYSFALYNNEFENVVSGDDDGFIAVWDIEDGQLMSRFIGHDKGHKIKITAGCFDSTQRRLITASGDGSCTMWNFSNGQPLTEL